MPPRVRISHYLGEKIPSTVLSSIEGFASDATTRKKFRGRVEQQAILFKRDEILDGPVSCTICGKLIKPARALHAHHYAGADVTAHYTNGSIRILYYFSELLRVYLIVMYAAGAWNAATRCHLWKEFHEKAVMYGAAHKQCNEEEQKTLHDQWLLFKPHETSIAIYESFLVTADDERRAEVPRSPPLLSNRQREAVIWLQETLAAGTH